jgi:hypothetical protein
MDELVEEYSSGVDDYYAGVVPDHWDNEEIRNQSAYLTGWYQASMVDNMPDWVFTQEETDSMDYDELMEKEI